MRFHKLQFLFSSLLKGVTFKMIGITAFFLVWFIFVLEIWIELFILYIAMPSFQLSQWKWPSAFKIHGHGSSLSLKFSSILGLCDPILPRLCRSRTLYFEISKELSQHIWSHTGKLSIECWQACLQLLSSRHHSTPFCESQLDRSHGIGSQVNSLIQPFLYLGINEKLGKSLLEKVNCCQDKKLDNSTKPVSTLTFLP